MKENSLSRKLGLFPATNIVIANMIGAGIFTTSGLLIADLHDPVLMIVLWFAGGIIALCGALSYGELGATFPEAGGEYMFLSRIFHPSLGFLSGWVSFIVGFSAPIAASAIGFSEYLLRTFPDWLGSFSGATSLSPSLVSRLISVSVIILFTVIHSFGIKFGTRVQNVLTILKVVLLIGFITAILFSGKGNTGHFTVRHHGEAGSISPKAIGLALMWIMFAYSGWNASTYIGSEIRNPVRNLPASLLTGTFVVIILYLLMNVAFVYAIPPGEMKGVISVGGLAIGNLFGAAAERVVSVLIAFALFSSLSAFIIIGPRVYFAMARDGLFFKSVAKIHPKFKVPVIAIALQGIIAIIFIITGSLEQILTYMGFSLGIFPLLAVAGSIKMRLKSRVSLKIPGFPIPQIIYLSAGTLILILSFLERPLESGIALATVAVGIPVYFLFRKSL